jgi:acetyl esterase/lipase
MACCLSVTAQDEPVASPKSSLPAVGTSDGGVASGAGSELNFGREPASGLETKHIIGRSKRWRIHWAPADLPDYARQLDFFNVELAVAGEGEPNLSYVANFTKPQPDSRKGTRRAEKRLCMTWNGRGGKLVDFDKELLGRAGISTADRVSLHCYSAELENALAWIEREHAAEAGHQSVEDFQQTTFGVRPSGKGYQIYIESQSYRHRAQTREEDLGSLKVVRNLVYAEVDDQPLQLDLYLPAASQKPPLVVWIHGGGWRAGSRKNPKMQDLTKHGYALASISYRFTDKAIFPAQIHDCKAAIRWLRAHAGSYGYNADWIAVAGSSAGGHLALLVGVSADVAELEGKIGNHFDQSSRVQAIIDYFGPSDFVLRGKTQPERAYTEKSGSFALLGGLQTQTLSQERERFASPAHYVSADDPPLLVFHGTADQTVLLDQSQRIVSLYHEADLAARLVTLEKAGHGGKPFFSGEHFGTAKSFLDQQRPK